MHGSMPQFKTKSSLEEAPILTILLSGEVHVQKQCKQQLFVRIAATQITDNGVE